MAGPGGARSAPPVLRGRVPLLGVLPALARAPLEVFERARALGDVVRHTDAITGGPGAIMHRESTAPLAADDFWHGVFTHVTALGEKDLTFAIELAESLGVDVPMAREALPRLGKGLGL